MSEASLLGSPCGPRYRRVGYGWNGLSQRTMGMGVGWHGWKAVFYLNGGHVGIRLGVLSPHQRLAEA